MKLNRCRYPSLMLVIVAALLASCTAKQPSNIDNICDIFSEQRSWYKAANIPKLPCLQQAHLLSSLEPFRAKCRPASGPRAHTAPLARGGEL